MNMKTNLQRNNSPRIKAGFTLIELLVVIAIIVILAGIIFAATRSISLARDIKQTKVRLANIQQHVETYAQDNNGLYPVGDDNGSSILYNALSGDFTGQGNNPTGETYWRELVGNNPDLVTTFQNKKVIVDAFGNTIRYNAAIDKNGERVQDVKNDGAFDLWSVGPDGEPSDLNANGLLQNDDTLDDIWLQ